ncbi:hypothetical protein EDD52_102455 [Primorskyibacter sedentarius]|uniref:Uncharacterized protein n=1 Tax=Primorskyibacter sedentarius TaxID=745311 RepID=A0A4R3JME4_9RHOB|nr:hypothetical protein EDD52_102455 [Primorskyibacter sedentarius]
MGKSETRFFWRSRAACKKADHWVDFWKTTHFTIKIHLRVNAVGLPTRTRITSARPLITWGSIWSWPTICQGQAPVGKKRLWCRSHSENDGGARRAYLNSQAQITQDARRRGSFAVFLPQSRRAVPQQAEKRTNGWRTPRKKLSKVFLASSTPRLSASRHQDLRKRRWRVFSLCQVAPIEIDLRSEEVQCQYLPGFTGIDQDALITTHRAPVRVCEIIRFKQG